MAIEQRRLDAAHGAFREWVKGRGGGDFRSFACCTPLHKEETLYKHEIWGAARRALRSDAWDQLRPGSGEILEGVRRAILEDENLLQRVIPKYGTEHGGIRAFFYPEEHTEQLETLLRDLYSADDLASTGIRFDALCDFLRSVRGFGCQWAPMAYLLFLTESEGLFPVHTKSFTRLLDFYGVEERFGGRVSWDRYRILLNVAEELRDYLSGHAPRDMIDIHSYMWVVSQEECIAHANAILDGKIEPPTRPLDVEKKPRMKGAVDKALIGLEGEEFVLEREREKLADNPELAERVSAVSWESDAYGYDVLSFKLDGTEIHIEVKTTTRSPAWDPGFFLSAHEAEVAACEGSAWRVHRVTGIRTSPAWEDLGNVVNEEPDGWMQSVASRLYRPDQSTA